LPAIRRGFRRAAFSHAFRCPFGSLAVGHDVVLKGHEEEDLRDLSAFMAKREAIKK
jgi:hypothetical protein